MLPDSFGRIATDLRVSLTDRCNLRCAYCMPPEGLDWLPTTDQLTDDEVVRLVRIGVERLGIREVRFTGGAPPGSTASTCRSTRCGPRRSVSSPAGTGCLTCSTDWPPRPRPACARSRSTPCSCGT